MRLALFTLLASVAAAPAFAADLGTYRPGTPYHSTIAPGADVCQSQCTGDARCRGWNYVKANPRAPGVCEFQSSVGAPVPSAISISGVSETAGPVSSRIVAGDTNTIRVGTSSSVMTTPPARNMSAPAVQPRRTIIRQPVPQQAARTQPVRPASHQHVPVMQRPQFQPMLDGQGARAQYPAPAYGLPMRATPMSQPQSRGPARAARQAAGRMAAAPRQIGQIAAYAPQSAARPAYNGRPPVGQTIAPPADFAPASQAQPTLMARSMPRSSASQPVTFQNASQGLYGSLHDDVRVPASNAAIPTDPNAPIPTASARPVAPVQQGYLPNPLN